MATILVVYYWYSGWIIVPCVLVWTNRRSTGDRRCWSNLEPCLGHFLLRERAKRPSFRRLFQRNKNWIWLMVLLVRNMKKHVSSAACLCTCQHWLGCWEYVTNGFLLFGCAIWITLITFGWNDWSEFQFVTWMFASITCDDSLQTGNTPQTMMIIFSMPVCTFPQRFAAFKIRDSIAFSAPFGIFRSDSVISVALLIAASVAYVRRKYFMASGHDDKPLAILPPVLQSGGFCQHVWDTNH